MRKQQEKILERARKRNFSESQITLLSREDFTIEELQVILDYITAQRRNLKADDEALANEAKRCITYLKQNKDKLPSGSEHYKRLLHYFLPNYYNEKDTLLGNKKKYRIFKMYRYIWKKTVIEEKNFDFFYVDMLYKGFSTYQINLLMRPAMAKGIECYRMKSLLEDFPCLEDDFLRNGQDSVFYHVAVELNIARNFKANKKELDTLYDWEKHQFYFKKEEFDKYFVREQNDYFINEAILEDRTLEKHPAIKKIVDFCKTGAFVPYQGENNIFTTWEKWKLENPEDESKIERGLEALRQQFSIAVPSFYFAIFIEKSGFITITYTEYKSICVNKKGDRIWSPYKIKNSIKLMISPDGKLFQKRKNEINKYYPLPLYTFLDLYRKKNICGDFMRLMLNMREEQNIFYRDVIKDCWEVDCIIPLAFDEIAEYHNRAELLIKKYKKASEIRIKWNKQNLNLSYLIIKAYNLVEPGISREILIQQKEMPLKPPKIKEYYRYSVDIKIRMFLESLLYNLILKQEWKGISNTEIEKKKEGYRNELRVQLGTVILPEEEEEWVEREVCRELLLDTEYLLDNIADYIHMCRQSKIKIRLDIRSIRQLHNLHNRIAVNPQRYRKETGVVKVPKKSKFLALREMLPEEFEWITTRKRLILETELQHHCVWSYADFITNDTCAIYSFVDTNTEQNKNGGSKRYTIEFRQKNGRYYVQQVQGKHNAVNADGMREYIDRLLNEVQDEFAFVS